MFKNGDIVLLEEGFFTKKVKLICLGDTLSCVETLTLKLNEVELVATNKLIQLKKVNVIGETTKHPHAELMLLYAQDAMETDKPWERWEVSNFAQTWHSLPEHPAWAVGQTYRRKPKTLRIGNKEVIIGDRLYYNNQLGTSFIGTVIELDFNSVVPRIALNKATNGNVDKCWVFSDTEYLTRVIKIDNYEIPEPLRVAPANGTRCYLTSVGYPNQWFIFCNNYEDHVRHLADGTLHLTADARDLHNKALLSFTTMEINDD